MSCGFSRETWLELLYEEVPPEEASRLRTHLDSCPDCRRVHDGMRRGRTALDRIPVEKVEPNVLEVFRLVALKSEARKRHWRLAAIASAAALLLSGALFWTGVGGSRPHGDPVVRGAGGEAEPRAELAPEAREELEGRLRSLERLVRLLASEVESNDREIRSDVSRTAAEVERMRKEGELLWRLTRQDVDQLFVAHITDRNDRNETGD